IIPVNGFTKEELIDTILIGENLSNHPLALTIKNYFNDTTINNDINYQEIAGLGIKAQLNDKSILVGNYQLLQENNINTPEVITDNTIVYAALNNSFVGYITLGDSLKSNARETIDELKQLAINNIIIASGDHENVVKKVASQLDIAQYHADLLPQNKVKLIRELINKKTRLLFVGDGINDAPSLALADIGISMGGIGSDAAIEAADVVIMNDDLTKIPLAIKISKKTKKIVLQNIVFALLIKIIILGLGILGLTGIWEAIFADVGVALLAILNAIKILYKKE
ncbi:MAG: HAD-IC family P-type ATPase, partial [Bacilli bacterium]|nr:HAD-IC family P-type ATPase [Bacilli bacterium]